MKIQRSKNAARNITFGFILKIYQISMPFLLRTVMIYYLGMEYLGLNSLFSSILQVLNLAELGVGSAMVYSMYEPIAEDDYTTLCAILKLYRKYYRIIGWVILIAGSVLTPFIPYLISGDVPNDIDIYILYLLYLLVTVSSYWIGAYRSSTIYAQQRNDIISKINIVMLTVQFTLQFIALLLLRNYYAYILANLLLQVVTNAVTAHVAKRKYPQIKPEGKLEPNKVNAINQRIKDLFANRVGGVIVNSADSIVISAFLGLTVLAVYNNYYYIMTSVMAFLTIIFNACTAGIGNSILVESEEKNFNDLKKSAFIIIWLTGFCTCCFVCLYQPFMELWVGADNMLNFSAVVCFASYFYAYEINMLFITYKDAAGIWHEDRWRPLITAITNLILNLISVNFIGIYGVLLSTVISTVVVGMPWLLRNLFSTVFHGGLKSFLKLLIRNSMVVLVSVILSYVCCLLISLPLFWNFIVRIIIACILPNILYFIVFRKTQEFSEVVDLVRRMIGRMA